MSLAKSLFKNGIASTIQKIVKILEQLILVPFFISAWGAAYYGEWLTLTIIPSMLAFSDLGFGSSAANKFLLKYASNDKQGAANTAKSGIIIITGVVIFSLLLSAAAIYIIDFFRIFEKSLILREDAIWAISLLMIARILGFYNQMFEAYYRAARNAALSINMFTLFSAINITVSIAVLIAGKGVIWFALSNLLVAILFTPFYAIVAVRKLGLEKSYKGNVLRSEIKEIAKNGFGYLLSPIWQAIYFQGTTFVVRVTLGPFAVTIFNTIRTFTRSVNQAFSLVIASTFPEFQYEIGAGNLFKARKVFGLTFLLVSILAVAGMIFLFFWGSWFYEIWTNKFLNPPKAMWNIFIIGIGFNSIWWTAIIIFQAFNKPYYFTIPGTIMALISVFITYLLSKNFGLTGAAIGSFTLDFILAFYVLPQGLSWLDETMGSFTKGLYRDFKQILSFLKRKIDSQ